MMFSPLLACEPVALVYGLTPTVEALQQAFTQCL